MIAGPELSGYLPLQLALQQRYVILVLHDDGELERALKHFEVDLLLLEVTSGSDPARNLDLIRGRRPGLPVVIFNGHGDNRTIARAFSAGAADGFRLKGLAETSGSARDAQVRTICNRIHHLLTRVVSGA